MPPDSVRIELTCGWKVRHCCYLLLFWTCSHSIASTSLSSIHPEYASITTILSRRIVPPRIKYPSLHHHFQPPVHHLLAHKVSILWSQLVLITSHNLVGVSSIHLTGCHDSLTIMFPTTTSHSPCECLFFEHSSSGPVAHSFPVAHSRWALSTIGPGLVYCSCHLVVYLASLKYFLSQERA